MGMSALFCCGVNLEGKCIADIGGERERAAQSEIYNFELGASSSSRICSCNGQGPSMVHRICYA